MKFKVKSFLKPALILAGLFFLVSCQKSQHKIYQSQKILMGTVFKIKVCADNKISKKDFNLTANKAFDEISRLEEQMSSYRDNSFVSKINKNAGVKPVKITNEIIEVVDTALEISKLSNGAFDITFGPLGKLWNVKHRQIPPSAKEIEKARRLVNYKNIILNKKSKTLFLSKKTMSIGLGGIAKGYAAKKIGEVLLNAGIENFIVNAGGDLYFEGKKGKKLWTSAIKNPDNRQNLLIKFKVKGNTAVVTSGNYERGFIYEGKKYHHIINPKTGYPADGIKSVTVFAKNPTVGDGWATAFFIMGYDASLKITSINPNIAFIMIDDKNRILKSGNVDNFAEII